MEQEPIVSRDRLVRAHIDRLPDGQLTLTVNRENVFSFPHEEEAHEYFEKGLRKQKMVLWGTRAALIVGGLGTFYQTAEGLSRDDYVQVGVSLTIGGILYLFREHMVKQTKALVDAHEQVLYALENQPEQIDIDFIFPPRNPEN